MKNNENQQLAGGDLITLLTLIVLTVASYGSYTRHIFSSEKISSDQIKAEILAYQAAQIFLLRNVGKKTPGKALQSRGIASESSSLNVALGEDSNGNPFRFQVIPDGKGTYRVLLSTGSGASGDTPAGAEIDVKINMSESQELEPAT